MSPASQGEHGGRPLRRAESSRMKAGALPGLGEQQSLCSSVVAPLAHSAFLLPTEPQPHNPGIIPVPSFPPYDDPIT